MTWTVWAAIVIVILTVAALIKRYETRLVLLASGFLMTWLSLDPMQGLNAFAKSMTNSGLIMAICSAMGFAFVVQMINATCIWSSFIGTFEQTWLTVNPGGNCYYLFHLHCDSVRGRLCSSRGADNDSFASSSRRQPSRYCRSNPRRNVRLHAFSRSFSQRLRGQNGQP